MDRPSRALRKTPGRLSNDRSKSRGVIEDSDVKKSVTPKSPKARKEKKKSSPPRRSRSRSTGRRKLVPKVVESKKSEPSLNVKAQSPPRTSIVSRIKESVESVRNSISPEVEEVVRRSISRFEEVKAEVVQRITPRSTSLTVTTRASTMRSRLSENVKENNVASIDSSQEEREHSEEKVIENHVGLVKDREKTEESRLPRYLFLGFLGLILSLLTLLSHVICTKDDCRLIFPSIEKVLNYQLYFNAHVWPIYTGSWLFIFVITHFYQTRVKKKPLFSFLGLVFFSILAVAVGYCHYYYNGVKNVDPLPILSATIFHMLFLITFAGNSQSIIGINIDLFVSRISSLLMILLVSNIAAVERSRVEQQPLILFAAFTTLMMALDTLVVEPLPRRANGAFSNFYTALKPFIYTLPLVYISANKVSINLYLLGIAVAINFSSYLFYRISLLLKIIYQNSSYKDTMKNSSYGNYTGGAWRRIRHPDLLGVLLYEWSSALTTYPCPLSWILLLLSAGSVVLRARDDDVHSNSGYLRTVKYSLIPFVY